MGDGAELPGYSDSIIEIRHCIVEDFVHGPSTGTEWPYCTGIMVSHRGADAANGTVNGRGCITMRFGTSPTASHSAARTCSALCFSKTR